MQVLERVRKGPASVAAKVAAVVALATAGAAAMADGATGVDVSGVTSTISAQQSSVTTVGLAILAVVVGIAAFVWIRKAIH